MEGTGAGWGGGRAPGEAGREEGAAAGQIAWGPRRPWVSLGLKWPSGEAVGRERKAAV